MPTSMLFKVSGGLSVLCGLLIAFDKLVPDTFLVSTLGLSAALLGLFMLTAVWLRQRAGAGGLGDVGYLLNTVGLALMVGVSFLFNYAFPHLTEASSQAFFASPGWTMVRVSYGLYAVGVALFGWAIWRGGVFPRAAALLYVGGFVGAYLGFAFGLPQAVDTWCSVVAAIAIVWLGLRLASEERTPLVA